MFYIQEFLFSVFLGWTEHCFLWQLMKVLSNIFSRDRQKCLKYVDTSYVLIWEPAFLGWRKEAKMVKGHLYDSQRKKLLKVDYAGGYWLNFLFKIGRDREIR